MTAVRHLEFNVKWISQFGAPGGCFRFPMFLHFEIRARQRQRLSKIEAKLRTFFTPVKCTEGWAKSLSEFFSCSVYDQTIYVLMPGGRCASWARVFLIVKKKWKTRVKYKASDLSGGLTKNSISNQLLPNPRQPGGWTCRCWGCCNRSYRFTLQHCTLGCDEWRTLCSPSGPYNCAPYVIIFIHHKHGISLMVMMMMLMMRVMKACRSSCCNYTDTSVGVLSQCRPHHKCIKSFLLPALRQLCLSIDEWTCPISTHTHTHTHTSVNPYFVVHTNAVIKISNGIQLDEQLARVQPSIGQRSFAFCRPTVRNCLSVLCDNSLYVQTADENLSLDSYEHRPVPLSRFCQSRDVYNLRTYWLWPVSG